MPFTIPDETEATYPPQARLFQTTLEILAAAPGRTGVVNGCAVTAQSTPDMTVAVGAGLARSEGKRLLVPAGNVTIPTADATYPRLDLVVVTAAGAKAVRTGTAAAFPLEPPLTAGDVVLEQVYLPAGATTVTAAQLISRAVHIDDPVSENALWYGVRANLRQVWDGAYGSSSTRLTSASAGFTADDVGRYVVIQGGAAPTTVTNNLTTTNGSAAFTLAGASLTQLDVGKWIALPGAGPAGVTLYSTITAVTGATTGTIAATASTTQVAVSRTVRYAGWLTTTITAVNSATDVTLAAAMGNSNLVGAKVSIATDDTATIQAFIDGLVSGQVAYFPPAHYFVATGPLVVNKQISWRGAGENETFFWFPDGTTNGIELNKDQSTKIYSVTWGGFSLLCLANRTAGASLVIGNVGQASFNHVKLTSAGGGRAYNGLICHQATQAYFHQVRVSGCANNGITVAPNASGQVSVDVYFGDQVESNDNLGHGLAILNDYANGSTENVQGVYVGAGSYYGNGGNGIRISPANAIKNLFFRGTIVDSNRSVGFYADGTATIQYLRLQDIWVSYNGNPALIPSGAAAQNMWFGAVVNDFGINGGFSLLGGYSGLTVYGAQQGFIQNMHIADNNQAAIGDYGISLQGGAGKIGVSNNRIYNANWALSAHQNGINISADCTNIDLFGNFAATNLGGSGTTPRTIAAGAGVREWGTVYDTTSGNTVPFIDDGLATTVRDVIAHLNTIAATAGVPVQVSPATRWSGAAWNGSASVALDARQHLIPVNATTPTSRLAWLFQSGGGGYTERMSLGSDGTLTIGGSLRGGFVSRALWGTD